MKKSAKILGLAACVSAAAAVGYCMWSGVLPGARRGPLRAVPASSFAVVSYDGRAARESPFASLLQTELANLPLVSRVSAQCGFDVLARVDVAALSIAEGKRAELGVALSGEATRDELLACARTLAPESATAPPVTRGSFHVYSTESSKVRLAMAPRGPLILGFGNWTDEMIDAAEGDAANLDQAAAHTSLREALTRNLSGAMPALVATMVLPKDGNEQASVLLPLAGLALADVRAVGLAIAPGKAGQQAKFALEVRCATLASCTQVRTFLMARRFEAGQKLSLRLGGFSALVDSVTADVDAEGLHMRAYDDSAGLAKSMEVALRAIRADSPKRDVREPSLVPNETIQAPATASDTGTADAPGRRKP